LVKLQKAKETSKIRYKNFNMIDNTQNHTKSKRQLIRLMKIIYNI
jgi:hypothetical protein